MAAAADIVIVLDINGVLADVRKLSERVPRDILPALRIPSGQRVYIRKNMSQFANFIALCRSDLGIKVAVWTSRKAENAEPIEEYLSVAHGFVADYYLHGEDCMSMIGFHPVKESKVLRRRLGVSRATHVVFVDDEPDRIMLDSNSGVATIHSYDALTSTPPDDDMATVANTISEYYRNYISLRTQ